jgi:hypothetical protein
MSRHAEHGPMTSREEIRVHLVAEHHWPAVARYDATADDLIDLHGEMHDPAKDVAATVRRIRSILRMPPDDE